MKERIIEFMTKLKAFDDKKYFEEFYSFLLSPVISGAKPASILTIKNFNKPMYSMWLEYGDKFLTKLNLTSKLLRNVDEGSILIIYSVNNLRAHLQIKDNQKYLSSFGYPKNFEGELYNLCERYKYSIPHECGIFLGIPRKDVEGYISQKVPILNGYWQVYDNLVKAMEFFNLYDKSKAMVIDNVLSNRCFNDYYREITDIFKTDYQIINKLI